MKFLHEVWCPLPTCEWSASIEVEYGDDPLMPWAKGVLRDALSEERARHVIAKHVRAVGGRRLGALMTCGCWWADLDPGSERGRPGVCPLHGSVYAVELNVVEPAESGPSSWLPAVVESETAR